jgi:hypothetical protein
MKIQPSSRVPAGAIQNSKVAATFLTLGLKLQRPGIFVTLDKSHPASSGGVANFLFESNINNSVAQYLQTYEEGTADAALDAYLSNLPLSPTQRAELNKRFAAGLIVWGRRILDNYTVVVRAVKSEVNRFVVAGGEPVYSNTGALAGIQNFTITQLKKS